MCSQRATMHLDVERAVARNITLGRWDDDRGRRETPATIIICNYCRVTQPRDPDYEKEDETINTGESLQRNVRKGSVMRHCGLQDA